ncbi:MAG TPA: prepilin-type N-terminal cleavage/methylation domain-containing protein [Candidatus Limnocylindria bacterium]|jgi:prepilin-type N-terminal cleavage/methylation domain-containing protein|nr:prepilin-type N-terminal cleavage/methylation domain-containing protein [Candidatus Limnocylindria bacterium]
MSITRHNSGTTRGVRALAHRTELAFTLIELLVVISIIALLAGLVVGLAPVVGVRIREAKVKTELADLTTAIETYKARFGVYPPDNYDPTNRITNPVLNGLYYELTGVLVVNDGPNPHFVSPDDSSVTLSSADTYKYFGRDGFVNSATPDQRRRLLRHKFQEGQHAEIFASTSAGSYTKLEVLAVGFSSDATGKKGSGFQWPLNIPTANHPVPTNRGLNPWRYVSSNPTNNPGTFDLWAEVIVKGQKKIYGNWKQ